MSQILADEIVIVVSGEGRIVTRERTMEEGHSVVTAHVDADARGLSEVRRAQVDELLRQTMGRMRHETEDACDLAVLQALSRAGFVVRLVPLGVMERRMRAAEGSLGGASGLGRF